MARAKRGINVRQFAERNGWVWRNVYRDVETLRAAGVPVQQPEHGRFSVPDSWLPPVTVDVRPDEMMALSAARQLAPGLKDTAIGRGLASLWSKLSAPGHQTQLPLGDETWFDAGAMAPIDYGPHQIVLDAVRESLRTRRALRIRYSKPGAEPSERIIEPAFAWWEAPEEALYVRAWCRTREEMRTFAIHRIAHAELTDELYARRREAISEMSNAFRLWARKTTERVVLWFSPRVAGEPRLDCPLPSGSGRGSDRRGARDVATGRARGRHACRRARHEGPWQRLRTRGPPIRDDPALSDRAGP